MPGRSTAPLASTTFLPLSSPGSLLRLMLTGADPARIQCLTFTKAAAAEMALRLQRTLGEWVTLPDRELDARLIALQLDPSPPRRS